MKSEGTLLLKREEVNALLSLEDCIEAIEKIFRQQGEGNLPPSQILGMHSDRGGLHIKTGLLPGDRSYFVAKLNTNFPANPSEFGLPTIQGVIVLCDATNGMLLALLDSIDITVKRTAAATAVAAKYLSRSESKTVVICGCGRQAASQLQAIRFVRPITKVFAFDQNAGVAEAFARDFSGQLTIDIEPTSDLVSAIQRSDICVTCTPSRSFFVRGEDVRPGTFVAAVGADAEHKQEIDPALMASAKVVADSIDQCCAIGDTHHAIASGLMRKENIYAELSEIVVNRKPGRTDDSEIFIFDSTGIAIEDAVAAVAVYEKASADKTGMRFSFSA